MASFIDPGSYNANVSLPTLVPATSQYTGHVLDTPLLYGATAFTDLTSSERGLVPRTPSQFPQLGPRDVLVAQPNLFPGDELYNGDRGLSILATSPSSPYDHCGLQDDGPVGAIVFSAVDLYGVDSEAAPTLPTPSPWSAHHGLQGGVPAGATVLSDGIDGVAPLPSKLPSLEPPYHGHQEEFPTGGIMFSDADLYGIDGEAPLLLPSPSTQPAHDSLHFVNPEATSTLTDAESHAWLMAGSQVVRRSMSLSSFFY